jgi:hypothetical protein
MAKPALTRHSALAGAAVLAALSFGAGEAPAQTAAGSACARAPSFTKLPDSAISAFKANPAAMLAAYASAGLPLSTQVRSLMLSDPTLVDSLIDLAKSGNDTQKAAIGAGLAQASQVLVCTNPQLAADIQQKVVASGMAPLITAYIAGSNGTQTAATGGGGGAGAGGGGGGGSGPVGGVGGQSGSNGGAGAPGSFGTGNGANGFAGGVGGGGGVVGGSSTTTNTVNGGSTATTTFSVSPTL